MMRDRVVQLKGDASALPCHRAAVTIRAGTAGGHGCRAGRRLRHLPRPSAGSGPPVLFQQAVSALTGGGFDGISVSIGGLLRIGLLGGSPEAPVPPWMAARHGPCRRVSVAHLARRCQHGTCRAVQWAA
ncbi:hypothetical protein GCM10009735_48690 [Actinomadura chokoriensis]